VSLVAGAYLLVKPGPLVGPTGLTASGCLAEIAPGTWAIEWVNTEHADREGHAAAFGIPPEAVPELVAWATGAFDNEFKWPNVFCTLDAARAFRQRFRPEGVRLIGLALPVDLVDGFLAVAAPKPQQPGFAPMGATGVYDLLSEGQALAPGGLVRGYEVLGHGIAGDFCSYRCNGLEDDFQREFAAVFNDMGLLDDEAVARRCAEFAGRPETGTCADWWHPWSVQEYDSQEVGGSCPR
jgi:hypothetical protein